MSLPARTYIDKLPLLPLSLILVISLICGFGIVILWSAAGGNMHPWAYKQLINFCIFLPVAIIIALIDIRIIFHFSYLLYFVVLILLTGVELFGTIAMGAKRWIDLGFIRLQPSELTKLAIVLILARYFHEARNQSLNKLPQTLWVLLAVILQIALIIKQPDLGTGIITLLVVATLFFAAGVAVWKFIIVGSSALISMPIVWHMMHDYQRKRVQSFLHPEYDPLGSGYNIIQSKIAIGSGGLFGKGLKAGTQSHLNFLPEHKTDFIFAFMSEEFGFAGGLILLLLYSLVIIISLLISINCRSIFGKLVSIGITAIFFSHIFINMAMVMGLLPAVGVPLPFISYGGTMMASMLIGFGVVMNAAVHRNTDWSYK